MTDAIDSLPYCLCHYLFFFCVQFVGLMVCAARMKLIKTQPGAETYLPWKKPSFTLSKDCRRPGFGSRKSRTRALSLEWKSGNGRKRRLMCQRRPAPGKSGETEGARAP